MDTIPASGDSPAIGVREFGRTTALVQIGRDEDGITSADCILVAPEQLPALIAALTEIQGEIK